MGSAAIIYAVVALALALACLAGGFFWGRSNVRAQIEDAVEKEHVALDAREFAMRTQLEDAIAENARLRPLAEELARVQKRLEQEQAKYARMKSDFNSSFGSTQPDVSDLDDPPPADGPVSADEAIHKLLQSLEVFNDPNAEKPVPVEIAKGDPIPPAPAVSASVLPPVQPVAKPLAIPNFRPASATAPISKRPPVAPTPVNVVPEAPKTPAPPPPSPAPAPSSKPAPPLSAKPAQTVDEWQEFARQLEALTGKKK
ncbi:MAG TPA: hypothetical protein VN753_19465 [Terracidiphilus sp.]|nr:hypothetical protein [Terracidiphilus sp.]